MNKREKLKADLKRLDNIDESIIGVKKALSNLNKMDDFMVQIPDSPVVYINYRNNKELESMLSRQLSHLKGEKSVLEIELGVDE